MKLYHGTKRSRANAILKNGFRHAKEPSYTGTGVNLTESMTIAYEHGSYELGGCVIECELKPEAVVRDIGLRCVSDKYFYSNSDVDAVISFGGNVWVVWSVSMISNMRILSKKESISILHNEFGEEGENMAYNGLVQDHYELYWKNVSKLCLRI